MLSRPSIFDMDFNPVFTWPGADDAGFANVFAGWTKSFFTPFGEASPDYGGLNGDPDHDGRSNFEEFIFGGDPQVFEDRPLPASSIVTVGGADYLAITFTRRHHISPAAACPARDPRA